MSAATRKYDPMNMLLVLLTCSLFGRCFSLFAPTLGCRRLNGPKQQLFAAESAYLERTSADSAVMGNANGSREHKRMIQMNPLSCPPLLLLQSPAPIISNEQCAALIEYFDHITDTGDTSPTLDAIQIENAKSLLEDVHGIIDKVTNCPRHDGERKLPRYVRYLPRIINKEILLDSKKLNDILLPDGCHVDTNNGKLFRHITAILYLTDNLPNDCNFGGGTTFPLAKPWIGGEASTDEMNYDVLLNSATRLLERNIHHTKGDTDQSTNSDGRRIEMAGIDVFHRDHGENNSSYNNIGVRVMPQAGRLIFFHNIDDDGMSDATSFHGGEELISIQVNQQSSLDTERTKNILVFFKEIPIDSFSNLDDFTDCVSKARRWTRQAYYQ